MPKKVPYYGVRPKRRIEQVWAHDPSMAVTNAAGYNILHTAEDKKTLVRIVGTIRFQLTGNPGAGTMGAANVLLAVAPNGVNILTPSTAQRLDQPKPKQLIFNQVFGLMGTGAVATDAQQNHTVEIDLKGQRVLEEDDEIRIQHIGNAAGIGQITYSLTMVFKE